MDNRKDDSGSQNTTVLDSVRNAMPGDLIEQCESRSLLLDRMIDPGIKKDDRASTLKDAVGADKEKKKRKASPIRDARPSWKPDSARTFYARNASRLMINMAGGVLENAGLCLDRFRDSPMIPGSALKGAARHAALSSIFEMTDADIRVELATSAALIFGWVKADLTPSRDSDFFWALGEESDLVDQVRADLHKRIGRSDLPSAYQGTVAFLPAFTIPSDHHTPEQDIEIDILNSHHPDYYSNSEGSRNATDDESPVPVYFPAVAAGHAWEFTLCPLRGCPEKELSLAVGWLKEGLTVHGIGAKTAAGYGWFEIDEAIEASIAEEKRKQEEEAARREREEKERLKEAEVLAAMDPIKRCQQEILKKAGSNQEFRANMAKNLESENEDFQRAFIRLFKENKEWREQLKRWRKGKNPKPAASALKQAADKIGEELP